MTKMRIMKDGKLLLANEIVEDGTIKLDKDGTLHVKEIIEIDNPTKIIPYLKFDNTISDVGVPHNNIFNLTNAITISAWIRLASGNTNYNQFLQKQGAFAWFLGVRASDGFTVWYSRIDGVNNNWVAGGNDEFIDGNWHHVVFSYDKDAGANNQHIYVDGVRKLQRTITGSFDVSTNPIQLVTGSFQGGMRDARIYNRQLSDSEIVDLFNEINVTNGLIGHWKMDEGEGNILYDSSGNGNNGNNNGGIWDEVIIVQEIFKPYLDKNGTLYITEFVEGGV